MEDFRVLHERFQQLKMSCIEEDEAVLARQRFNSPHTNIHFIHRNSGKFLSEYEPSRKRLVAWFDYAKASKRVAQIAEFQELLRKAPAGSIIKITLNANPDTLGGSTSDPDILLKRKTKLCAQFNRFLDDKLSDDAVLEANLPATLLTVVREAAMEALSKRPAFDFKPLASFYYKDSQHQMMTITGFLGMRDEIGKELAAAEVSKWHFGISGWSDRPRDINVPELTAKERIHINQMLPRCRNNIPRIVRRLKFPIDPEPAICERKLTQYVDFYRHYPHFGRVAF